MRIAISGSAGVGKSTLAAALADRLGVPLIEEHYERFFEPSGRFKRPPPRVRQLIWEVLEQETSDSVSDRCPVDLFNLWLTRGFARRARETEDFQRRCVECLATYDFVVIVPWGRFPLSQTDPETTNRRRVMNPWVQFHSHSTIIGLIRQWIPPKRILPVPAQLADLDARVNYLLSRIAPRPRRTSHPFAG